MKKIAVITLGEEEFGIDIGKVVEILRAQKIFHLPQLPSFFSGMINIRGVVVPLLDLRVRFGLASASGKERIVVIRIGKEKVGLLVDGVKEIIDVLPEEESGPPSMVKGLRATYLTGIAKKGNRMIILLNIDTLLTSEEKLKIETVTRQIPG